MGVEGSSVGASALAPFAVRSFRFQWPADLATSWAFEMEALILGWYVLSTTGSVEQMVAVASLIWLGTLLSPFFGLAGDRFGARTLLCATRGAYALCAATLATLTLSGLLETWHVFLIATINGLLRPSDTAMRYVMVGQTIRPEILMGAIGLTRTSADTARVAGALTGTGGVALVGMGPAYAAVATLYVASFLLSLGLAPPRARQGAVAARAREVFSGLKQGVIYVWRKPDLLGALCMAFLINLFAFPFTLGLLPYVAKEVFHMGQSGLGWLAAAAAIGALIGSLAVSARMVRPRAARAMLWAGAAWFAAVLLFGQTRSLPVALALLFFSGMAQGFCIPPIEAVLLRGTSEEMRGRVMGLRVLAVWGLPLGLLASGPVIAHFGFPAMALLYGCLALAATLAIGYGWRGALWHRAAPANSRA
ncbi:MAG TPA: MFS transporter [Burkholderiales bacterium]|nr:MFS transporter [Burkholderiales bacterium]